MGFLKAKKPPKGTLITKRQMSNKRAKNAVRVQHLGGNRKKFIPFRKD